MDRTSRDKANRKRNPRPALRPDLVERLEERKLFSGSPTATVVQSMMSPAALVTPRALQQPRVGLVSPRDGTSNVRVDSFISAEVFVPNGGIDASTLVDANVFLTRNSDGAHVATTLNTSGGGDVIILTPNGLLDTSAAYTFHVTSGLKDVAGAAFQPKSTQFTTSDTV